MASVDLPMEIPQTGPISLSGGDAEQEGHWPIPEGVVLASLPKRVGAWMLDTIFVMGVLLLLTTRRCKLATGQFDIVIVEYPNRHLHNLSSGTSLRALALGS